MSDIAVHSGLFNGFVVFATLKVSQQQALWNWPLNNISFIWLWLQGFNSEIQLFSLQMIINSYKKNSPDTVNIEGHAVDTLTGLLIDLIYNFDIPNLIWMNIRDWKATSRYQKFWHIEIWGNGSKLSWKSLSLKTGLQKNFDFTEISSKPSLT